MRRWLQTHPIRSLHSRTTVEQSVGSDFVGSTRNGSHISDDISVWVCVCCHSAVTMKYETIAKTLNHLACVVGIYALVSFDTSIVV